jgi:hypothetical protein
MVSGLIESLGEILRIDGVGVAALVDAGTGTVVRAAGAAEADLGAVAARVAEEVHAVAVVAAAGDGDLEEFTAVTSSRFQMIKVMDPSPGEDLLLFVDADRTGTNVAFTTLRVGQAAPALLA